MRVPLAQRLARARPVFRILSGPSWDKKSLLRPGCRRFLTSSSRQQPSLGLRWPLFAAGIAVGVFGTALYTRGKPQGEPRPPALSSTKPLALQKPAEYDLSSRNINAAVAEMESLLGAERVTTNEKERIARSSTSWSAAPGGDEDRCSFIVFPRSTDEVSEIAKICWKRKIPMMPFAGGTSLEGTLAAVTRGGCCIDFREMHNIVAFHPSDLDVVCQPGVPFEELNAQLAPLGLFFPPDPGPGAQIGGMISQGCSGTNAYRYGTMKDWVLGLTVVLADGTIVKTRNRPRKSSAGYNLTQLMVGSEGTLGIVTEASLKVTGLPRNVRVAVVSFDTVKGAVDTVIDVVRNDLQLGAIELLDETCIRAVNQAGYVDKEFPEIPHLFLKFAGHSETAVSDLIQRTRELAKRKGARSFDFAKDEAENDALWAARKTCLWSLLALKKPEDGFLSIDTAVPISKMPEILDRAKKICDESGMLNAVIGHVGDGNFHTSLMYPKEQEQRAREILSTLQLLAIEMEGTITGEHGIGLEYRDMLVNENGPAYIDAMRQVKFALDPLCLMNPDKLFRINWTSKTDSIN